MLEPLRPIGAIQGDDLPFSLPFNTLPGPTTWLLGQPYGNTVGAFNTGQYWYRAGQGLHFGIDFPAPCKTPITAIADGVVVYVDNFAFGVRPHNVILRHARYTSVYGHLFEQSSLKRGQTIKRGEIIGYSGDPDETCVSRPHLHLEVRSLDYKIAYNPSTLIDADWMMMMSIGSFSAGIFEKDLFNPNRWQTIFDQPDIHFQQRILNNFSSAWPIPSGKNAPPQTLKGFTAPTIDGKKTLVRKLTSAGCCSLAWWAVDSNSVKFWDGLDGSQANVMAVSVFGGTPVMVDTSPPKAISQDNLYVVSWEPAQTRVHRLSDGQRWTLKTDGVWPRLSPDNTWLLWMRYESVSLPGSPAQAQVFIMRPDGTERTQIASQRGGSIYWLDDDRILLTQPIIGTNDSLWRIYTISRQTSEDLLTVNNPRDLRIAPGGEQILYYTPFQVNPSMSQMYILRTQSGATPQALPFFGSSRWRDSKSIIYIPFTPGSSMEFRLYNIATGQDVALTDPAQTSFRIANNDWSVSPNGQHILFWDASDLGLQVIDLLGS